MTWLSRRALEVAAAEGVSRDYDDYRTEEEVAACIEKVSRECISMCAKYLKDVAEMYSYDKIADPDGRVAHVLEVCARDIEEGNMK